jgi:hypothetical protein
LAHFQVRRDFNPQIARLIYNTVAMANDFLHGRDRSREF